MKKKSPKDVKLIKTLSGLLLFYNAVIITDQEINYLTETHYKPSDTGKLDKFHNKRR